jgi:hypothetical protein
MYPTPVHNFVEYEIPKKSNAPVGQVYLGTFLAFILFSSFFFGNLLFFLIVLIISIFIFLEKEVDNENQNGNIDVGFYENYFHYGRNNFEYRDCLSFTFYDELFGSSEEYVRIVFKSRGKPDLFIFIPETVQKKDIYAIIRKSLKEDSSKELSFTDKIVLRFF